jgi:hypothetical protein
VNVYFLRGRLDGTCVDDAPAPPGLYTHVFQQYGETVWEIYTYSDADPLQDGRRCMRCVMLSKRDLTAS